MQFNPSSTTGIVYMTRFYAKANSNDLTTQDIVNLSNLSLDEIYPEVAYSSRVLNFDDPTYGDDPYETHAVSSGSNRLALTSDANSASILGVRKVAVTDSTGAYHIIDLAGLDEIESEGFVKQSNAQGKPERYFQFDKALVFDPTPNYDMTVRVFYKRRLDQFTSADTTAEPGFDPSFHELVPMMNAYRWCRREGKRASANDLSGDIERKRLAMKEYYGNKNADGRQQRMKANVESTK